MFFIKVMKSIPQAIRQAIKTEIGQDTVSWECLLHLGWVRRSWSRRHEQCETMKCLVVIVVIFCVGAALATTIYTNNEIDGYAGIAGFRRRCPLCDSSVYSYCSEKLFHDSCCCHNPNNPYDRLPYQCKFADCSFLHANSCQEHKLITACCCTTNLFYKK